MLGYISRGHSKEVKDQKVYLNIYGNYGIYNYGNSVICLCAVFSCAFVSFVAVQTSGS